MGPLVRVMIALSGPDAGNADVFVEDLPAHPNNSSLGTDGLIWTTATSPAAPTLALLQKAPAVLRAAAARSRQFRKDIREIEILEREASGAAGP